MANQMINREFSNIIPAEIDSEIKFGRSFTAKRFVFIILFNSVTGQLKDIIHPRLLLLYYVFCALISIVLVLPSRSNPGRLLYDTLLLSITRDRRVYHPIDTQEDSYE